MVSTEMDLHAKHEKVIGIIPLTSSLVDAIRHGHLSGLGAPEAEEYLKENLHRRVLRYVCS